MKYALDTNTIIRLLRKEPFTGQKFGEAMEHGGGIAIPPLFIMKYGEGSFVSLHQQKKSRIISSLSNTRSVK